MGKGENNMKRFPHTETTDMIVYVEKPKKKRNVFFVACVCSALISSFVTAGIIGTGAWIYSSQKSNNIMYSSDDIKTLSTSKNNSNELSIPQIAKMVGPSCVGVVNKTKVEPRKFYDPFSRRLSRVHDHP